VNDKRNFMRWLAQRLGRLVPLISDSAYVIGTALRRPRLRSLGLRRAAERHLRRGHPEHARQLALELLAEADRLPRDWNSGNAFHHGHLLLGRIALLEGDVATAGAELLAAARTPGSPQLNSFGPNCQLALELLQAGQPAPVLAYLEACGSFWKMDFGRRAEWMAAIRADRAPPFGPNLLY
jgi:hypothetical protein